MAKGRSPNFPAIDLETALQRAREIWNKESRHPAAPETILGHWGYSPKSSGGLQTLAALKQFGLLADEGRGDLRRARVSDLGQSILFHNEGTQEWFNELQKAVLSPPSYQDVWDRYKGELPSDQNLLRYLMFERGFTEGGADEFIRQLRNSLAYAGLTSASARLDELDVDREDNALTVDSLKSPVAVEPSSVSTTSRAVQLPYSPSRWATLQAAFPLTERDWDQMLAVLNAMKPALTTDDSADESGGE
jgi:hypothetical protein